MAQSLDLGSVIANFKANTVDFERGVKNVQGGLKRTQKKMEAMRPAFQKMALVGSAAFAGVAAGIGKAVSEAGDAEKISQNFQTTFGDSAGAINDFISEFGSKFAFVESEMRDGANSIGFQLNAMGEIGAEEGEKITESLLTAAGGLSDFFGEQMNVADASKAMAKGLAGNRAQLIDMGFNVLEEDIENAAEAMGMNTKELTKAQEAQVFTKLIMDQTKGSVEGLTDGLDTYTGRKRAFRKVTKETSETLGNAFLPMVTEAFKKIKPVVEQISNWIKENQELTKWILIGTGVLAGLVAIIGMVGLVLPSVITGFTLITGAIGYAIGAIKVVGIAMVGLSAPVLLLIGIFGTLAFIIISKWDLIKAGTKELVEIVKGWFDWLYNKLIGNSVIPDLVNGMVDWFKSLPDKIVSAISKVFDVIVSPFRRAFDKIKSLVPSMKDLLPDVKGAVLGFANKVKSFVPGLATGVQNFGGGLAMVGEEGPELVNLPKGSDVIPNDQMGSNVTVNMYGTKVGDQQDIQSIGQELGFRTRLNPLMR